MEPQVRDSVASLFEAIFNRTMTRDMQLTLLDSMWVAMDTAGITAHDVAEFIRNPQVQVIESLEDATSASEATLAKGEAMALLSAINAQAQYKLDGISQKGLAFLVSLNDQLIQDRTPTKKQMKWLRDIAKTAGVQT